MKRRDFLKASLYAATGLSALFTNYDAARSDPPPVLTPRVWPPHVVRGPEVTTRYIDAVNGNDSTGTGLTGAPYKTLGKALSVAGAGDTILARGDGSPASVYNENALSSAVNGLTIQNDVGHTPIFSCAIQIQTGSWTLNGGNVYRAAITNQSLLSLWHGDTRLVHVGDIATCGTTPNSYYDNPGGLLVYVNVGGGAPTSIVYYSQQGRNVATDIGSNCTWTGISFKWNDVVMAPSTCSHTLSQCIINHIASFVGAFYITGATLTLSTVTMADCGNGSNAMVRMVSGAPTVNMTNCAIIGPGISGASCVGVVCDATNGTLNATSCSFTGCTDGVDMRAAGGGNTATLSQCTFVDCIHGCARSGVSATNRINVYFCRGYNTTPQTPGYGIIADAPSIAICVNNTFDAMGGHAYFCNGAGAQLTVIDCIGANCVANGINNTSGTVTEHHNCFYNNAAGNANFALAGTDLTSNPQFVSPPTNLQIANPGSPCLSAGVLYAGVNDAAQHYDIGWWVRGITAPGDPGPGEVSVSDAAPYKVAVSDKLAG